MARAHRGGRLRRAGAHPSYCTMPGYGKEILVYGMCHEALRTLGQGDMRPHIPLSWQTDTQARPQCDHLGAAGSARLHLLNIGDGSGTDSGHNR